MTRSLTTRLTPGILVSEHPLPANLPQQAGRLLWAPMLAMAAIAFPAALALAVYRAAIIAQGAAPSTADALGQLVPAVMFLGFASAFAAISFAIARILGVLRTGGGSVQAAAARHVQTLAMPLTAKLFIGLMAMAMMVLLFAVAAHVVIAIGLAGGTTDLATARTWAEWLEGVRRFGASTYLLAIGFGLATIYTALGFQSRRIRELPAEPKLSA
jgi:hypothetical protein